jgi:hypothetical protein
VSHRTLAASSEDVGSVGVARAQEDESANNASGTHWRHPRYIYRRSGNPSHKSRSGKITVPEQAKWAVFTSWPRFHHLATSVSIVTKLNLAPSAFISLKVRVKLFARENYERMPEHRKLPDPKLSVLHNPQH